MAAHAGEKAREGEMFHDQRWNGKGRVNKARRFRMSKMWRDCYDERTEETSGR